MPFPTKSVDHQDGTYEACLAYLDSKGYTLWGDYSLNPDEDGSGHNTNEAAARWLEAQVRGVADHYDTPANPAPAYAGTHEEHVAEQQKFYSGPYSTETTGGGKRPSALHTHGQQAESW